MRREIVALVQGGEAVAAVARRFQVSRRTVYKWVARFELGGEPGTIAGRWPPAFHGAWGRPTWVAGDHSGGRTEWISRLKPADEMRFARSLRATVMAVARALEFRFAVLIRGRSWTRRRRTALGFLNFWQRLTAWA